MEKPKMFKVFHNVCWRCLCELMGRRISRQKALSFWDRGRPLGFVEEDANYE